jgi:hypothetical protein
MHKQNVKNEAASALAKISDDEREWGTVLATGVMHVCICVHTYTYIHRYIHTQMLLWLLE